LVEFTNPHNLITLRLDDGTASGSPIALMTVWCAHGRSWFPDGTATRRTRTAVRRLKPQRLASGARFECRRRVVRGLMDDHDREPAHAVVDDARDTQL
jgi:hypothetical protein